MAESIVTDQNAPAFAAQDELKQLISTSNALNEAEKKYWLDLLATMNEGLLEQLKGILVSEQKNLEEIDRKYDHKLEEVAQKTLNRWDSEKAQVARLQRTQVEAGEQQKAEQDAEALLKQW
ncbi:MAG: hypothetical protein U1C97_03550 [Candidatus Gracilibacteria bacterium]|nr:hypothetical protein [Candidatus Gracilibacteria bacterium]